MRNTTPATLITATAILLGTIGLVQGGDKDLETYISSFNYEARKEMKIDSKELIELLKAGKAQLIDIRFKEEYAAWRVGPSKNIPLPELPRRLKEIDRTKTVVLACPHKDRAIIAMTYLRSKNIKVKYLTDGLIGLAENLRGDKARDLINKPEVSK